MPNSNYYFTLMSNSNLSKIYVKVGSPNREAPKGPAAYLVKIPKLRLGLTRELGCKVQDISIVKSAEIYLEFI